MQTMTRGLTVLVLSLFSIAALAQDKSLADAILDVQHQWAHIHYQLAEDQQEAAFPRLETTIDALIKQYPHRADPLVWKAIVLATHAGVKGGLSALSMVRDARDLLERAEKIDATALDGSIYTTLGSLYYQVPGWPLGYGDDKKAEVFLKKALAIDPTGIDANYFYGDFLYRKGHYLEALSALEKAMHAPGRLNRPLADEGRRKEIQAVIAKIKDKT